MDEGGRYAWVVGTREARSLDRYWVMARAKLVDENGAPVPGVAVTVEWQYPHGRLRQQIAPTTPLGWAKFRIVSRQVGWYTFTVLDAAKPGWTYDPDANHETSKMVRVP